MVTLLSYLVILLFFLNLTQSSTLSCQYSSLITQLNRRSGYQKPTAFRSKSACRIFIWDALSACRYHLCNYLLKDSVYEGLGGRKFVRIKPGSILESLYPPSNHGPDKCLICGSSFRDHLQCWWYPHLYSSYDRHLDETQRNGIIYYEDDYNSDHGEAAWKVKQVRKNKKQKYNSIQKHEFESGLSPICSSNNNTRKLKTVSRFSYHNRYVREVKNMNNNCNNNIQSQKRHRRNNTNLQKRQMSEAKKHKQYDKDGFETLTVAGVKYSVPVVQFGKNNFGDFLLITARVFTLSKLDQLLWIERFESCQ